MGCSVECEQTHGRMLLTVVMLIMMLMLGFWLMVLVMLKSIWSLMMKILVAYVDGGLQGTDIHTAIC